MEFSKSSVYVKLWGTYIFTEELAKYLGLDQTIIGIPAKSIKLNLKLETQPSSYLLYLHCNAIQNTYMGSELENCLAIFPGGKGNTNIEFLLPYVNE